MNKMTKFSYMEYREILKRYAPIIKDFQDVDHSTPSFCLLRHDVEFSIERALKIKSLLQKQSDLDGLALIGVLNKEGSGRMILLKLATNIR